MKIICNYFKKHDFDWKNIIGFCTSRGPAMLGSRSGKATLVKVENPDTITMHCIIHR